MSDVQRWFVYLVECADQSLYAGVTNDIEKRLHAHNHLKSGAAYTRSRRPVKLVYHEVMDNKSEAFKREAEIKKLSRAKKLSMIQTFELT